MKNALADAIDELNGITGFVTVLGFIIWIGLAITGDFLWYARFLEGYQGGDGDVLAFILGFLGVGGYLYGFLFSVQVLLNLFKKKSGQ